MCKEGKYRKMSRGHSAQLGSGPSFCSYHPALDVWQSNPIGCLFGVFVFGSHNHLLMKPPKFIPLLLPPRQLSTPKRPLFSLSCTSIDPCKFPATNPNKQRGWMISFCRKWKNSGQKLVEFGRQLKFWNKAYFFCIIWWFPFFSRDQARSSLGTPPAVWRIFPLFWFQPTSPKDLLESNLSLNPTVLRMVFTTTQDEATSVFRCFLLSKSNQPTGAFKGGSGLFRAGWRNSSGFLGTPIIKWQTCRTKMCLSTAASLPSIAWYQKILNQWWVLAFILILSFKLLNLLPCPPPRLPIYANFDLSPEVGL